MRSFGNPSPATGVTAPRHRRTARTSEPAAKQKALVISTRSMEAVQDGLSTPISPTSTRPSVPRWSTWAFVIQLTCLMACCTTSRTCASRNTTPTRQASPDHVFGLMHLLGFRFAPRIRDLGETKLFIPKGDAAYDALKPMISSDRLNIKQIRAHWDEILRLATSIKQGTVTASLMLRKLGSYPRQNGLAVALRELGRIERTLFILDWLQSVELRRRVHAGLNKGEARNALAGRSSSTDWVKSATAVLSSSATGPAASIW